MTMALNGHLALAFSVSIGIAWGLAMRRCALVERLAASILPTVVLVLSVTILAEYFEAFFRPFTDARVAPAASLWYGHKLYYGLEEGPILGMMYSPLGALAFTPALVMRTPEEVVGAAEVLAMIYYFAPAMIALIAEARHQRVGLALTGLVLASFGFVTLSTRSLSEPAFWIHVDAPAICFAALSCAWLQRAKPNCVILSLCIPAICAVCAVLSKQVALPIIAVMPAYLLLSEGWKGFARGVVAVSLAVASAALITWIAFDVNAMFLNTVLQPARQPWYSSTLASLGNAICDLFQTSALPLVIIGITSCIGICRRSSLQESCIANSSLPWLLAAGFLIPTSLLGRMKIDGTYNALGYCVYFIAVAAHLGLVRICSARQESGNRQSSLGRMVTMYLVISLAFWIASDGFDRFARAVEKYPSNPERKAFEYAKEHPEEVYFPFHPLVTLMSEGKCYHFSDGIRSRELSSYRPSRKHIWGFLPKDIKIVASTIPYDHSQTFLPEFSIPVVVEGLDEWHVFTRELAEHSTDRDVP